MGLCVSLSYTIASNPCIPAQLHLAQHNATIPWVNTNSESLLMTGDSLSNFVHHSHEPVLLLIVDRYKDHSGVHKHSRSRSRKRYMALRLGDHIYSLGLLHASMIMVLRLVVQRIREWCPSSTSKKAQLLRFQTGEAFRIYSVPVNQSESN